MFRNILTATSDAVLLFDAGAGQVRYLCLSEGSFFCTLMISLQSQGGRRFQEDRCEVVLPDQFPAKTDDKLAFFAIYDGQYVQPQLLPGKKKKDAC